MLKVIIANADSSSNKVLKNRMNATINIMVQCILNTYAFPIDKIETKIQTE